MYVNMYRGVLLCVVLSLSINNDGQQTFINDFFYNLDVSLPGNFLFKTPNPFGFFSIKNHISISLFNIVQLKFLIDISYTH